MVMTEKIIELISGKLGGEAPTFSFSTFIFLVGIFWLLLRKSFNVSCGKLRGETLSFVFNVNFVQNLCQTLEKVANALRNIFHPLFSNS